MPASVDLHVIFDNHGNRETPLIHPWLVRVRATMCIHARRRLVDQLSGALVRGAH